MRSGRGTEGVTPIPGPGEREPQSSTTPPTLVEIGPPEGRERWGALTSVGAKAAAIALFVALIAWLTLFQDETIRLGSQLPSPGIALAGADADGWELLESGGAPRPNFPEPMVWHGDRLCVGFSRVDFDVLNPRPSLARCVDPGALPSPESGDIVVVATVRSGNDTWHFIEFGSGIHTAEVRSVDGAALADDRVHMGSSTLALRLPNQRSIAELRWTTTNASYRCVPDPDVWHTAQWCPPSARAR